VRDLPLALANPWLGDGVKLDGRLRADATFGGRVDRLRGQWTLSLESASTRFIGAEPPLTLVFQQAALTGNLENDRLEQQLDLVVADQGELHPWNLPLHRPRIPRKLPSKRQRARHALLLLRDAHVREHHIPECLVDLASLHYLHRLQTHALAGSPSLLMT